MDDKCINATGLAHIWKAITQVFATKEYVDDELAKVDTSGGGEPLEYITDEEIDEVCSMTLENYLESIAAEGVYF